MCGATLLRYTVAPRCVLNNPRSHMMLAVICRMLRLFRALRALKGFRVILRTFTAIFPTFMRYLAVLFVVYYQFAIIGTLSTASHSSLQHGCISAHGPPVEPTTADWRPRCDTPLFTVCLLYCVHAFCIRYGDVCGSHHTRNGVCSQHGIWISRVLLQ